ncbi:MAG: ATP-binding protein [Alphaproteobacteria bacterium]|nr:ATP-binding protein [Rhizobiaceae bacterium]MBU4136983.1 ATP-binding protein [Alphaproteobacteria bacterium]
MASENLDLTELVDDPNERLAVEYKAFVDPNAPVARAKLARHIAALANHGGGYLVVGFNDDLSPSNPRPGPLDRDFVASVVRKYLEPPFQCDVRQVTARSGLSFSVVVVPSHSSVPICAKAGGPQIEGKVQGLQAGAYYVRKPGPASEAILTAAEWGPLIRRCALHERASILGAIDIALRGAEPSKDLEGELEAWHRAAAESYIRDIATHGASVADVDKRHFQFSYLIDPSDGGPPPKDFITILDQVNQAVDQQVHTGWGMFHIFYGGNGARFTVAPDVQGGGSEFVETNFIRDDSRVGATDLWRVSPEGFATLIRGYIEDTHWWTSRGATAGTAFSPNQMVMSLAELVLHAATLAIHYPASTQVLFRCEWVGLEGRSLDDFQGRWMFSGHQPREDRRLATAAFSIGELTADWSNVVERLAGPVARAFGVDRTLTADWIAGQASSWRRR